MHAHFRGHVYHRHSHETYSLGVTESGAQGFTCRGAGHVSTAGLVMAFNPDDPHDGHAATGRFGLPPSDYQRQLRLRAARRALAGGTAVADVAAATGFADQAHLTRWFRRCYGITPGAYRAACA
jgi:methylphosphotriester-DNA--protein-cysteine methyltransferase